MPPANQIVLSTRYYLDHFNEMIAFLRERYDHALLASHRTLLHDFEALGLDARCLYVRLANRKGRVFRWEALQYEEITNLAEAATELRQAGFIREPDEGELKDLLIMQTRPTLIDWIRQAPASPPPKLSSLKKRDLVRWATAHLSFQEAFSPDLIAKYVVQDRIDETNYLFFLYFGKLRDGLTAFALRDLGVVKPTKVRTDFQARFENQEAALVSYHYAKCAKNLRDIDDTLAEEMIAQSPSWPRPVDQETALQHAKVIGKLGRYLERQNKFNEALQIYNLTTEFPSTERSARLLYQLGHKEKAREKLEAMISDPSCDEELFFAEDFYERKFGTRRVGRLTEMLRSATVLHLDESGRGMPESAVVGYLSRQGVAAWHVENKVWQMLFGLFFWDILYGEKSAPLHNSFELRPRGLDSGKFATSQQATIQKQLEMLSDPETTRSHLSTVWETHQNAPNALFDWDSEIFATVLELVKHSPNGALHEILSLMTRNHRAHRSGFPDLMILDNDRLRFAEIKTAGDKLQRHQLTQLERLRRLGYTVEVLRVEWTVDPNQEYVVVDVETTGGNAKWNRVTEIGAVKIRGGTVVDEWTTLLHPQRPIPKRIVSLTGITDEMVAEAPPFSEVAEDFRTFLGDAVFVAHRAAFDYGFLRAEFQRIDRDLKCPTLCTVVAMRRYFPGLKSYGLASLCEEFSIPLEQHHRALADARATAHLLVKINERRLQEVQNTDKNRD